MLKNITLDIDVVGSWSAFTKGQAAVPEWKIQQDISTIPVYMNIK